MSWWYCGTSGYIAINIIFERVSKLVSLKVPKLFFFFTLCQFFGSEHYIVVLDKPKCIRNNAWHPKAISAVFAWNPWNAWYLCLCSSSSVKGVNRFWWSIYIGVSTQCLISLVFKTWRFCWCYIKDSYIDHPSILENCVFTPTNSTLETLDIEITTFSDIVLGCFGIYWYPTNYIYTYIQI